MKLKVAGRMAMKVVVEVGFILTLIGSLTFVSAETCDDLNALVAKTYGFKPSKLTSEQINAKSNELDVVWNTVKSDKDRYVPCLRTLTVKRVDDKFFRFNASNLLVDLDPTEESKRFLLQAYAEVDLADINVRFWIPYVVTYGFQGMDTSGAGENWLRYPDPKYYLPQHGTLAVDKAKGAVIIFGSMEEAFATPTLMRIAGERDHPGRDLAALVLTKQFTTDSIKALKNLDQVGLASSTKLAIESALSKPKLIAKREGNPLTSREEYLVALKELGAGNAARFMEIVSKVPDGEKDAVAVLKPEDVPMLRKARRFFASTGTPHAPEWYQSFTDIIATLIWKDIIAAK